MIEFPITAFRLQGYDEHICLEISEVQNIPLLQENYIIFSVNCRSAMMRCPVKQF